MIELTEQVIKDFRSGKIEIKVDNYKDEELLNEALDGEIKHLIKFAKTMPTYYGQTPRGRYYHPTPKERNMIEKPSHYIGENGLEVERVLTEFMPRYEDGYIAHRVSSAIEYLLRSPLKNGVEDIKKAKENLEQVLRYIAKGVD